MKKIIAGAFALVLLSGCAAAPFQPGLIYTGQKLPLEAPNQGQCVKTGTSSVTNILGLFATGDASIAAAKKAGGITKVDSVDVSHSGFLTLYSRTTTEVCGE